MLHIPLIHSGVFEPFLTRAASEGDWLYEELWMAGLPLSLADGAERIINFKAATEFVSRSAKRLGVRDLGLQVGAATHIRCLPRLDNALMRSTTLLEGTSAVDEALQSVTSVWRLWLDPDSRVPRLCLSTSESPFVGAEHAEQYALMLLVSLVREVAGKSWSPSHVTVGQATFDLIGRHPKLLDGCIATVEPLTSVTFEADLLDLRIPVQHSAGPRFLWKGRADHGLEMPGEFKEAVQIMLETNLRSGRVGLRCLTHTLGVSPRTLQRELAAHGLTYAQLLGEARLRLALEQLANPENRIAEIAFELGYQDAANFTRAFKRWTGLAPLEYRRRSHERCSDDGCKCRIETH